MSVRSESHAMVSASLNVDDFTGLIIRTWGDEDGIAGLNLSECVSQRGVLWPNERLQKINCPERARERCQEVSANHVRILPLVAL